MMRRQLRRRHQRARPSVRPRRVETREERAERQVALEVLHLPQLGHGELDGARALGQHDAQPAARQCGEARDEVVQEHRRGQVALAEDEDIHGFAPPAVLSVLITSIAFISSSGG